MINTEEKLYTLEYDPIDPVINEFKSDELKETFNIVYDINEWSSIMLKQSLDIITQFQNTNVPKLPGLYSCFSVVAAEYIIDNFNVKAYMTGPTSLLNGQTITAKSFTLKSIHDLNKYISKKKEIYLYDVLQNLVTLDYKKETNDLVENSPNYKFMIRLGVID